MVTLRILELFQIAHLCGQESIKDVFSSELSLLAWVFTHLDDQSSSGSLASGHYSDSLHFGRGGRQDLAQARGMDRCVIKALE